MTERISRRSLMHNAAAAGAALTIATFSGWPESLRNIEASEQLPWNNGKYQTFPRIKISGDQVCQNITIGTLGPDVDTLVGVDFQGNLDTGDIPLIYTPGDENIEETRVVFLKRTDIETLEVNNALGGDRFDMYQISKFGGDRALDAIGLKHAQNTARKHQKVVYLHDIGMFEEQWGANFMPLLSRVILTQRPSKLGIPEPDFVNQREF